jgi:hypothetical protein
VDVVSILDGAEFRDFPDRRWPAGDRRELSFADWLKRFIGWLFPSAEDQEPRKPLRSASSLPRSLGLFAGVLTVLCLAGFSYLVLRRRPRRAHKSLRVARSLDAASEPPDSSEPDASPRAARDELCALYRASLQGLAARGLLTLASHATNGSYVRALSRAREREELSELTRLFERTRYGAALPSEFELRRARELASGLCGVGSP